MGYATIVTGIFDLLIAAVVGCSSFSSSTVTGAYLKSWQGVTYPIAMIRPLVDRFGGLRIAEGDVEQTMRFRVEIKATGTGTQDNVDTIMCLAGEVVDAIEADRTLGGGITGSPNVQAKPLDITYSLSEQRSAIFYYAYMTVEIKFVRRI